MCVCKNLNQSLKRIGERNGKSFKGVSKTKKEKKHLKRLSFITQFNIEFFLPFTGCRKVLGKMRAYYFYTNSQAKNNKSADYILNGVDFKAEEYLGSQSNIYGETFLAKSVNSF